MSKLFSPSVIGPYEIAHRVILAPLTRMRSEPGDIPGDLMVEYYRQRASRGGFMIAEASPVSPLGIAYAGAPGIYADAQIAGWRKVTDAVHAAGSRIFLQLWHSGRQSHPDLIGGETPVGPSALLAEGVAVSRNGEIPFALPRALEPHEIPELVAQFRRASERAMEAGFDGVELHSANGYLTDQFLQDGSNVRTDAYGGTLEKRARFLLEVVEAMTSVWGGNRTAVRISPSGKFGGMSDSNPQATFSYATQALNRFGLAYLHVIEPRIKGTEDLEDGAQPVAAAMLRRHFQGPLMAAGGFDRASAEAILEAGVADTIAFGRAFLANPDLPERFRRNLPLNAYDRSTFYGGDHRGYVDYPFHAAATAA
ncbi:alkene reductase [Burkholderia perseverans]|uniref:alkene reductase n=1 Tax=Burkholderia perseverans TaxID=2615214 RepID=UPI001FEE7A94|nr:alkene reductase [Burkholderia perseverans]